MPTLDITATAVSVPSDTSGSITVYEDVDDNGGSQSTTLADGTTLTYDNADTVTLVDGQTSYTTADVFDGGSGNRYYLDVELSTNDVTQAASVTCDSLQVTVPDEPATTPEPGFEVGTSPIDLPLSPINLQTMQTGIALFLVGWLGLLLGAAALLRNYLAGIMWSFALFALIASGLFGIGLELFWALSLATVLLLLVGMAYRGAT